MVLFLELRFKRNNAIHSSTYYIDMLCFSEGGLPVGNTILDLPPGDPVNKCLLGAYETRPKSQQHLTPGSIESYFTPARKLKYSHYFIQFANDGSTTPKEFPGDELGLLLNNGYTPIITWEPMFKKYSKLDPVQPRLNDIINGTYDAHIDAFADKCKSYNDTIIIRLMHEFNGNWYSWSLSENGQDPARYIAAYRKVVDRFRARGATKVKWMWCPNNSHYPEEAYNWAVLAYPGNDYVDFIGFDMYNSHYPTDIPWWISFRNKAAESYYYLNKYFPSKPIFIGELGCREREASEEPASQTKAQWIAQMDKELQSNFKNIRALVFFSQIVTWDWRVNSTQATIDAISNNIWNDNYYFEISTTEPDTLWITAPADSAIFNSGDTIAIDAETRSSKRISKVQFYSNSTELGSDTISPFSFIWTNTQPGKLTLTARMTDTTGAVKASAPVNITIKDKSGPVAFISAGSQWKYLDNGTNQGTAWRDPGFNDQAWKTGYGQFGYGDGDENTKVNFGSSDYKYITTYFRKTFHVADRAEIASLRLEVLRDDGAVVYINGTEVFRSNMPPGTITYTTRASSSLSGSEEDAYIPAAILHGLLVNGPNTIAVEIHQSSRSSSDLSFDLRLTGNAEMAQCETPSGLFAYPLYSTSATLNWSAVTGALSYNLQYRKAGATSWATVSATSASKTISALSPSSSYEFRVQSVCESNFSGYSAPVAFTTLTSSAPTTFIAPGSSWKYNDSGSNAGTSWRYLSYNDSGWKTGNAELGYGDGDEATVVSYGPSSSKKHITTYFRRTFSVEDKLQFASLEIGLLRDDGAVVYINGTEVFRSNMPPGSIGYTTLAKSTVDGSSEDAYYQKTIPASMLVNGTNLVAVEVHQSSAGSSDISYNLALKGSSSSMRLSVSDSLDDLANDTSGLSLNIFPNPAIGAFSIELEGYEEEGGNIEIKVFNNAGQLVHSVNRYAGSATFIYTIELPENISKGIYILQVRAGKSEISRSVVIAD
jgi:beta-mannanase